MKFLNLAQPKKVFEKLNKMNRKQAYTVGAIIVVAIVAFLMLVTSLSSSEDALEGMNSRGYDLAQMPFVNDAAEKMLLSSYYPDMRENGSTLLYTPLEREKRQQEDQQEASSALEGNDALEDAGFSDGQSLEESDIYRRGNGAAGRDGGYEGRRGGRAGRTPTEIGRLDKGSMASGGGSGINSFYGPSVDNRGLQGQQGYVEAAKTTSANAKQDLRQMRFANMAAARDKNRRLTNARTAMQGGYVPGMMNQKEGPEVGKFGGLLSDTDAMPKTTDLDNLDKAVDNAVKNQQEKEKEKEKKLGFWEQLGQDLLRRAAGSLVDSLMNGVGDWIKGGINGNAAARAARKQMGNELAGKNWNDLSEADQNYYQQQMTKMGLSDSNWTKDDYGAAWGRMQGSKEQAKMMRHSSTATSEGNKARTIEIGKTNERSAKERQQKQQEEYDARLKEMEKRMEELRDEKIDHLPGKSGYIPSGENDHVTFKRSKDGILPKRSASGSN